MAFNYLIFRESGCVKKQHYDFSFSSDRRFVCFFRLFCSVFPIFEYLSVARVNRRIKMINCSYRCDDVNAVPVDSSQTVSPRRKKASESPWTRSPYKSKTVWGDLARPLPMLFTPCVIAGLISLDRSQSPAALVPFP